ncbi:MAG: cobalamin/Fe3+-siderophore ABC transporter ATP-binding protein, partial [Phenylobacterium zucineum]
MTTSALQAEDLSLGYDRTTVFEHLDLDITEGTVTTLVGANGSGKSTVLKAFGRLLAPERGLIRLDGTPIQRLPSRQVARRLALLPQKPL